jgi:hypothetical protein
MIASAYEADWLTQNFEHYHGEWPNLLDHYNADRSPKKETQKGDGGIIFRSVGLAG